MKFKIILLNQELIVDITESNYELIKLKLIQEKEKITNILRKLKDKQLINSIRIPIDKTLIHGKLPHKTRKTNTELQNKLGRLFNIRNGIIKLINEIELRYR